MLGNLRVRCSFSLAPRSYLKIIDIEHLRLNTPPSGIEVHRDRMAPRLATAGGHAKRLSEKGPGLLDSPRGIRTYITNRGVPTPFRTPSNLRVAPLQALS